jgi:YgiT-type zinc finger domain-containing protein
MSRRARDVEIAVGHKRVVVRRVAAEECPICGERLYDLAALRRIREARQKRRRGHAA